MGLFKRVRNRMRSASLAARRGDKDALTMASTCEESYCWGDQGAPHQTTVEVYMQVSDEESLPEEGASMNNKTTTTTKATKTITASRREKQKARHQDRDDLQLLKDYDWQGGNSQDDIDSSDLDDERDDVSLLNTNQENNRDRNVRFAYSFDQLEEEPIFEPSFEVALLEQAQIEQLEKEELDIDENESSSATPDTPQKENISRQPQHQCKLRPQRRYDSRGRPFLHIFHDGLATLYEEASHASGESDNIFSITLSDVQTSTNQLQSSTIAHVNKIKPRELPPAKQQLSDDVKMRARWDYALALMKNMSACEWDNVRQLSNSSSSQFSSTSIEI